MFLGSVQKGVYLQRTFAGAPWCSSAFLVVGRSLLVVGGYRRGDRGPESRNQHHSSQANKTITETINHNAKNNKIISAESHCVYVIRIHIIVS